MKKFLFLLLALCLILTTVAACTPSNQGPSGNGGDETPTPAPTPNPESDFEYEVNEDGNVTITKYVGTDDTVVLPSAMEGKVVSKIGIDAFTANTTIVSITVANTVTHIDTFAFSQCTALSSVTLPEGLVSIGNGVFSECTALSNIALPSTLTSIGASAFRDCATLKQVQFPRSLSKLGNYAFQNSGLENVTFEAGITLSEISECAFAETQIVNLVLPSSIQKISYSAFAHCTNLQSISLNNGLQTIEDMAFGGISQLEELVIPATVINMTELAVDECSTLKKMKFEGNAPTAYVYTDSDLPMTPDGVSYTVYYHEGATGFTPDDWCGYQTAIW